VVRVHVRPLEIKSLFLWWPVTVGSSRYHAGTARRGTDPSPDIRSQPWLHPSPSGKFPHGTVSQLRQMKVVTRADILGPARPAGVEAGSHWCPGARGNSGPGVARHLELLRPLRAASTRRIFSSIASPPASRQKEATMEVMFEVCCGLDVHKRSVAACVRQLGPQGGG
jgi:hypothetical protein